MACSGDMHGGSAAEVEKAGEELSALDTELQGLRQNVSIRPCCTAVAGMQGMLCVTSSRCSSAAECA